MNRAGRLAYFAEAIGAEFPFEEFCVQTRKRFYEIVKAEGLPVKPGVKELLWYGKDKGYRMAVATSSSKDYAYGNLKNAGIERFLTDSSMEIWCSMQNRIRRSIKGRVRQ